jgi:hypothetical protein
MRYVKSYKAKEDEIMPLPLIIGGIAAVAGVAGVGSGIHGGVKMKEANDTMKSAKSKQERAVSLFVKRNN